MGHAGAKLNSPFRVDRYAADPDTSSPARFWLPSVMLVALVLSGCSSRDEAVSPIPATPPPSATAALPTTTAPLAMALSNPVSGLSFSSVELGLAEDANHRILAAVSRFAPTDTIHAAVETMGSGEAVLTLLWTCRDGSVVQQESRNIKAVGPQFTEFTLARPGGLAAGHYTLKVSINGNPVERKDFSVR